MTTLMQLMTPLFLIPTGNSVRLDLEVNLVKIALNDPVVFSGTLHHLGDKPVRLKLDAMQVYLELFDARGKRVEPIPFMCELGEPVSHKKTLKGKESYSGFRVFGSLKKGDWKGFGQSGAHEGTGLELHFSGGATVFPLVPGSYQVQMVITAPKSLPSKYLVGEYRSQKVSIEF